MKTIQTMRPLKFVSAVVSYLNCHQFFPQKLINTIEKFMVVYKDVYTIATHVDIALKDFMSYKVDTIQRFLCELVMKPHTYMHLKVSKSQKQILLFSILLIFDL